MPYLGWTVDFGDSNTTMTSFDTLRSTIKECYDKKHKRFESKELLSFDDNPGMGGRRDECVSNRQQMAW